MLEVAFLASHLLWMTTYPDMETLYDLVTVNPAKCINLRKFELQEKNNARDALTSVRLWRFRFRVLSAPVPNLTYIVSES